MFVVVDVVHRSTVYAFMANSPVADIVRATGDAVCGFFAGVNFSALSQDEVDGEGDDFGFRVL